RNTIDDIARAFVDSEGGGHLHEATPLEGVGPHGHSAPNGSGSALRWTLHHLMQAKGANAAESLYTGRSSLAGGISGDGVTQYLSHMFSLIRPSAEEEAEQVVSGALRLPKDKDKDKDKGASAKAVPEQAKLMEQLIAGAEKRVPWSQNKLDIHSIESMIVNRAPQKAEAVPQAIPTPSVDTPLASKQPSQPPSPPSSLPSPQPQQQPPVPEQQQPVPEQQQSAPEQQQPLVPEQQPPLVPEQQQQQQHKDGASDQGGDTEALLQVE
ncbi:hypothetical protein GGF42_009220, partial [Coemansia sp. RSA 2424]